MDIYIYVIPYYIIEMVNIPTFIFKQSMKLVKCHDGDFICQHVAKSLWTLFRTNMLLRKNKKTKKNEKHSLCLEVSFSFSRRVGMGMSSNRGVCLKMTKKNQLLIILSSFSHIFPKPFWRTWKCSGIWGWSVMIPHADHHSSDGKQSGDQIHPDNQI